MSLAATEAGQAERPRRAVADELWVAGGLSLGAALIHVVAVAGYYGQSKLYAALFAAAALSQVAAGVALARPVGRRVLVAIVGLSAGVVAAWALSRTVGPPFGPRPWTPEPVAPLDALATADEVVIGVLVLAHLRGAVVRALRPVAFTAAVGLIAVSLLAFMVGYAGPQSAAAVYARACRAGGGGGVTSVASGGQGSSGLSAFFACPLLAGECRHA